MSHTPARARGFTLIELAIVILIIGLLAGGVVVGREMINASRLRSIISDFDTHSSSVALFQKKYTQLPGDFSEAIALWGAQNADANLCKTASSVGTPTCNGNGDGKIGEISYAGGNAYESPRLWQHLKNAGFAIGSFNGVPGTGMKPDQNAPTTAMDNATFSLFYMATQSADPNFFNGAYGNVLAFGAPITNNHPLQAALMPDEAKEIDVKVDNGLPGTGRVRSLPATSTYTPTCVNTATPPDYNVTLAGPQCSLLMITGF